MKKFKNSIKSFVTNNQYTLLTMFGMLLAILCSPTFACAKGLEDVLKTFGTIGAVIVGIICIIIVIIDAPKIAKGEKAAGKTIAKVLILILFAALIVVATNMSTLSSKFGDAANGVVDIAQQESSNLVG